MIFPDLYSVIHFYADCQADTLNIKSVKIEGVYLDFNTLQGLSLAFHTRLFIFSRASRLNSANLPSSMAVLILAIRSL